LLDHELLTKILDYTCLYHHKRDWQQESISQSISLRHKGHFPGNMVKCNISFLPARTFFFHENKLVVSQNTFSYVIKIVLPFSFQSLITGVTVSRVR